MTENQKFLLILLLIVVISQTINQFFISSRFQNLDNNVDSIECNLVSKSDQEIIYKCPAVINP